MLFIHFIESDFHVGLLPSQEEVFFVFKFHYSTSLLEMNSLTFVYLKMSFFILSSFLKDCQADRFFPLPILLKLPFYCFLTLFLISSQPSVLYLFCFLKILIIFIFIYLALVGLHCCSQAFSGCGKQGILFITVRGLLIAVSSLVTERGMQLCGLQQSWHTGSVVAACMLSCPEACGIFPKGIESLSPAWQANS